MFKLRFRCLCACVVQHAILFDGNLSLQERKGPHSQGDLCGLFPGPAKERARSREQDHPRQLSSLGRFSPTLGSSLTRPEVVERSLIGSAKFKYLTFKSVILV